MPTAKALQMYCLSDPDYYDVPGLLPDEDTRYSLAQDPVWPGWHRSRNGLWSELFPDDAALPEQGWKFHISAVSDQADATLDVVAAICRSRRVAFKFLRSKEALAVSNGKYMPRASGGKFITVYPVDERQFSDLLGELAGALDGSTGPYILSDLRIGAGPVHVRYGAFAEQWCAGPDGDQVLAIRDPDGLLVPDDRAPVFRLPSWVEPPAVLRPALAARAAATAGEGFPYRIVHALNFTNAGGTYLGEHRETGQKVVLREARPNTGLDGLGADACSRLRHEFAMLSRLDGLPGVPRVYGKWKVWEHEFIAEEYIEGQPLLEAIITRHPMRFLEPASEVLAGYVQWTEKIIDGVTCTLDAMHARGISFGDLHPSNVMLRPDDSVVLIDFEYAGEIDSRLPARIGAPGFCAPGGATSAEADWYALRATWLMMLMPMAELADRDPGKIETIGAVGRQYFGLGQQAGPPVPKLTGIAAGRPSGEATVTAMFADPVAQWPAIKKALTAGILRAATPGRADRLFPADPDGFRAGGAPLANGAAGVLLALHRTGTAVPSQHADWLAAAVRSDRPRGAGTAQVGHGLFDGLHGVAVVLDELGRRQDALELLSRCDAAEPASVPGLSGGQAGVALTLAHFARVTGESKLLDQAVETAFRLDEVVRDGASGPVALPEDAGLLHGMTGAALLQVRLYEATGEASLLAAARRALAHDIGHCVTMQDGTIQVKSGHRHLLYLGGGSGGIALVAREYLKHEDDAGLAAFVEGVRPGCAHRMVREPGLIQGRAGLLGMLAALATPDGEPDDGVSGDNVPDDVILAQTSRLGWHAVYRDGTLLIPGRHLRRFSADLASGSAGVLLALEAVFGGSGDLLSLLLPRICAGQLLGAAAGAQQIAARESSGNAERAPEAVLSARRAHMH